MGLYKCNVTFLSMLLLYDWENYEPGRKILFTIYEVVDKTQHTNPVMLISRGCVWDGVFGSQLFLSREVAFGREYLEGRKRLQVGLF